jgi:predicted ester cyclase
VSEENKALVRREEELFSGGNLDVADEIYAPDYVGHAPSNPEDVRGLEAAKQAASDYRQAFPDLRVTVEDLIAEGDRVAARLRFRGTHLGELNGIAPTGRRVDCTGIVISRIEEGKIAEDWANLESTWAHRLMVLTLAAVIGLALFTVGALGHPFSGAARIGTGAFELILERFDTSKLSHLR